eukprot:gene11319-3384_t
MALFSKVHQETPNEKDKCVQGDNCFALDPDPQGESWSPGTVGASQQDKKKGWLYEVKLKTGK